MNRQSQMGVLSSFAAVPPPLNIPPSVPPNSSYSLNQLSPVPAPPVQPRAADRREI